MSFVLRQFDFLISNSAKSDYKSCHYIMAMGNRSDGVKVFSSNGAAKYSEGDLDIKIKIGHAEQKLVRKLDKGSEVYVARLLKDGSFALAKPCKMCRSLMKFKGVSRAYYTIGPAEYGVIDFNV